MRDSIMRSWIPGLGGALPLVASLALVSPASAVECAPHDQVKEKLAHDFDEKPVAMGLSVAGAALVIFASPAGTWTTTIVTPQGAACVVDVGEGWTDNPRRMKSPRQTTALNSPGAGLRSRVVAGSGKNLG